MDVRGEVLLTQRGTTTAIATSYNLEKRKASLIYRHPWLHAI